MFLWFILHNKVVAQFPHAYNIILLQLIDFIHDSSYFLSHYLDTALSYVPLPTGDR